MKSYTVAVYFDIDTNVYSITCRSLVKNKHWKRIGNQIYDSKNKNPRMFSIVFEGPENEAKKFKIIQEAAYSTSKAQKMHVIS